MQQQQQQRAHLYYLHTQPAHISLSLTLNQQSTSSASPSQSLSQSKSLYGPLLPLLLLFPVALVSFLVQGPPTLTCFSALLAIAPLAERLGFLTEQLTFYSSDSTAALLNITFGNATEFLLSISALKRHLLSLVQLSLLGSVLSNLLLVIGTSFVVNGVKQFPSKAEQSYDRFAAQMNMTLMFIACSAVLYPTMMTNMKVETRFGENEISRGSAVILILFYAALLYFQLVSHKHMYQRLGHDRSPSTIPYSPVPIIADDEDVNVELNNHGELNDVLLPTSNGPVEPQLSFGFTMCWLLVTTAAIAILAECIADSIEEAAVDAGISAVFISAVLIPIAANAAEHFSALLFASKGKLDLTLNVAIGSSLQIALCVIPLLILTGWIMKRDLTLNFGQYEGTAMFLAVLGVAIAVKDGSANYLIGIILTGCYIVIAMGFFVHTNNSLSR